MLKVAVIQNSVCSPSHFFLGMQLDYIFQLPWQLGMTMQYCSSQWSVDGNDVCRVMFAHETLHDFHALSLLHVIECRGG